MLAWSIFGVVVIALLALDLGVFHRKAHEVKMKGRFSGAPSGLPWR